MPFWADFYKYFTYAFKPDPLSRRRATKNIDGVGVTQPDAIPSIRSDNWWSGNNKGQVRLRDSNDFIDLSSVTSRKNRYLEYERLRYVAEIEAALDVLADESCVSGDTQIMTQFGPMPIKKLCETRKPGERFLVYCYDFKARDYTLGWAHDPRKVKTAPTIDVFLDIGGVLKLTEDHKVLLRDGQWIHAGDLKQKSELMPFYRVRVRHGLNFGKTNQFPRIFTFADGWKHERQFVDEWRLGDKAKSDPTLKTILKCLSEGLDLEQTKEVIGNGRKIHWSFVESTLRKNGFSYKEIKSLNSRCPDRRRVIGIAPGETMDVYDLSVDEYENFATDNCILHNCQLGDNNHTFEIFCSNEQVKKELQYMFHRVLQIDKELWGWAKNLFCMGDWFGEIIIDTENPKAGILKVNPLPADSMYRLETTKGKLLEFQQSADGPDYLSLSKTDVTQATDTEIMQATAMRFAPEQIVHMKIGDDRKLFYPYGVSIIEPARGPAHQLRMMEDAMVVYRLCLIGYTRIRTLNSYKYIKNIKVGDDVWAITPEGKPIPAKVTNFYANGIQKVYKVRSKHIEITGTATHPLMVNRDGVIQLVDICDIKPKKDKLLNIQNNKEKSVKIPKHLKRKYVDEDFARLFGFLTSKSKISEDSICFDTKNEYYLELIKKYFGNVVLKKDKFYLINSSIVLKTFSSLELSNKIPNWVFTSYKNIRCAFIKGISDSIGKEKIKKNGIWSSVIKTSNKELLEDIKEIWHSSGFCSGLIKNNTISISEDVLPQYENVLSVDYVGEEEVFDFTVDKEEHNFIANGTSSFNTRAPERRVFYIDVGNLPPNKAEAFIERLKDQLRKKKMYTNRASQTGGAGSVEERWHAPSADEDFWLPIRPSGNTRIETLPGAQNLGEVDDALYFRNKLLTALHLPKNYLSQEDPNVSKMTLSSQDFKFARYVERLQGSLSKGIYQIAERHLVLQGFPEEMWEDLDIKMTPPSEWREVSRMDITQARMSNASTAVQSGLMSKYDALVEILKYPPDVAREMASRAKMQAIEDMKIQVIGQNPDLLGVGQPGQDDQEMGAEAGGPNPLLGSEPQMGGENQPPTMDQKTEPGQQDDQNMAGPAGAKPKSEAKPLPEPEEEDIKKYDLEIRDFSREKDEEEIDPIELGSD